MDVLHTLLALSVALFAGLLMSRLTKIWNLPAVTAYLVAGILIGPYCLGQLGVPGLGLSRRRTSEITISSRTWRWASSPLPWAMNSACPA